MAIIDDVSLPGLLELKHRSDADSVRIWLADRGYVAVDRKLMDELVSFAGSTCGAVYHQDGDYYLQREKAA